MQLSPVPISIDTRKPEVMQAAVAAGAGLINDVNALQESRCGRDGGRPRGAGVPDAYAGYPGNHAARPDLQ